MCTLNVNFLAPLMGRAKRQSPHRLSHLSVCPWSLGPAKDERPRVRWEGRPRLLTTWAESSCLLELSHLSILPRLAPPPLPFPGDDTPATWPHLSPVPRLRRSPRRHLPRCDSASAGLRWAPPSPSRRGGSGRLRSRSQIRYRTIRSITHWFG